MQSSCPFFLICLLIKSLFSYWNSVSFGITHKTFNLLTYFFNFPMKTFIFIFLGNRIRLNIHHLFYPKTLKTLSFYNLGLIQLNIQNKIYDFLGCCEISNRSWKRYQKNREIYLYITKTHICKGHIQLNIEQFISIICLCKT